MNQMENKRKEDVRKEKELKILLCIKNVEKIVMTTSSASFF